MCTIVAALHESKPDVLRRMAVAVRHRGPDSLEVWTNERHGIAACRLSIYGDPDAPMIYKDRQTGLVVLLNGEIYNYADLWRELEREGLKPETNLETELVARLYSIRGERFASRLKGMFAIAILDGDRLVLARDRFGIKPLYYFQQGSSVLVCSEIKGLLAHPRVTTELNVSALEDTAVFGYVHSREETFFKGIRQVQPGTVLTFDSSWAASCCSFGSFPPAFYSDNGVEKTYPDSVRETKRLVVQAVERMFRHGTMEKGLYLSGGLDSTTLAYAARAELDYSLKTFSLADSPDSPDLLAARAVAKALGTEHREFTVSLDQYWRWLPDYVAHLRTSWPAAFSMFKEAWRSISCRSMCPSMSGLPSRGKGRTSCSAATIGSIPILSAFRTGFGDGWPPWGETNGWRNWSMPSSRNPKMKRPTGGICWTTSWGPGFRTITFRAWIVQAVLSGSRSGRCTWMTTSPSGP
jgi:asparagine synthase (glutamine-hydrolysing)